MLKLDLEFRTPKAVIKDGKPMIEYETASERHIVASTKSKNNLLEDLKQDNKVATTVIETEIFINKDAITNAIAETVANEINDKEIADYITAHMIKALDGACVFKREPKKRK